MKRVYIDKEVCMGCGICQVFCATLHSKYPDSILKAYKLSEHCPIPRLYIERRNDISMAVQCQHCDDPICAAACITGAIYKEKDTGLVLINGEKCIGCYTCLAACPYGAIRESGSSVGLALKCDMCRDKAEIPVCVANCPNEALSYGEV